MTRRRRLLLTAAVLTVIYAVALSVAAADSRLATGAALDLTVTATVAVYFFAVRPRALPGYALAPVYGAGMAVSRLAFGPAAGAAGLVVGAAELGVLAALVVRLRRVVAAVRASDAGLVDALEDALPLAVPPPVARLLATEVGTFAYAFAGWRRPTPKDGFSMHRERSYLLVVGVLVFLALVETAGLHVVLSRFAPTVAWVLTALSAYSIVWLVGDAQAVRLHPVRIAGDRLIIQQGLRWRAAIPLADVAAATAVDSAPKDARSLGLLGANVLLELRRPAELRGPFGLRRGAARIALTVDGRDGFLAALSPRAGTPPPGPPPSPPA